MADYRLAPEHPFPGGPPRLPRRLPGLLAEGGADPAHLVVSGDSCGGVLGLGALLAARDARPAPPACFLSISGWFDVSVPTPRVEDNPRPVPHCGVGPEPGPGLRSGPVALDDPRLSPAYADLAALPPLYLPVGQYDTVRKGEALAGRH